MDIANTITYQLAKPQHEINNPAILSSQLPFNSRDRVRNHELNNNTYHKNTKTNATILIYYYFPKILNIDYLHMYILFCRSIKIMS